MFNKVDGKVECFRLNPFPCFPPGAALLHPFELQYDAGRSLSETGH